MGRDRLNIDELFKFYYRPLCLYATHYVQDVEIQRYCAGLLFVFVGENE